MGHFTPVASDLVRLRSQILINVVFLLFLQVKAGVDDETLMSFGRRVLGFCTFVSYNIEKEVRGLRLRKPVSGLPPCCSKHTEDVGAMAHSVHRLLSVQKASRVFSALNPGTTGYFESIF